VNAFKKIIDYLKDVQIEIKKVIWPKKQEVVRLTLVVFAISGIVAVYVGILDYVFTKSLELIVTK
jgi:preprotein translocase subunit SecE